MKDESPNLRANMTKIKHYGRVNTSSWKKEMKHSSKKFQRRIKNLKKQSRSCKRNLSINRIISNKLKF